MKELKFKKLSEGAVLPTRANASDAGLDLYAAHEMVIRVGEGHQIVSTGLAVAIPEGWYGRIAPRSGLAIRYGLDILAGVVDSGYRSDIGVVLVAHDADVIIEPGDRIAQLIIEKIETPVAVWADELDETARGEGGFGSSGD